jgi:excisionase family DNA binding protein
MPSNIGSLELTGKPGHGLLSVKEAAAYLRMSEGWIYQSGIPFAKLGRRRLYRRSDLDHFVEQHLSHDPRKIRL